MAADVSWQSSFVVLARRRRGGRRGAVRCGCRAERAPHAAARPAPRAARCVASAAQPAAPGHLRRRVLRAVHAGGDVHLRHRSIWRRRRSRLSTAALGWLFVVYLVGAVVTPFAGRWIDAYGHRAGLGVGAGDRCATGALLTLVPWLPAIVRRAGARRHRRLHRAGDVQQLHRRGHAARSRRSRSACIRPSTTRAAASAARCPRSSGMPAAGRPASRSSSSCRSTTVAIALAFWTGRRGAEAAERSAAKPTPRRASAFVDRVARRRRSAAGQTADRRPRVSPERRSACDGAEQRAQLVAFHHLDLEQPPRDRLELVAVAR